MGPWRPCGPNTYASNKTRDLKELPELTQGEKMPVLTPFLFLSTSAFHAMYVHALKIYMLFEYKNNICSFKKI